MVMNLTQQMSNWQLNLWYAWLTQQGTMCLPHKKPYLSVLPVLELLGYKLGLLDMKVPGSAQHCKRHLYPTPNTRTRGGAGVARRDAEWKMARLCWDPPLLSVVGIPSTRGFGASPAQPDSFLSSSWLPAPPAPHHATLPRLCSHSGRRASHLTESWTLGKKSFLCCLLLYWEVWIWWAEHQGYLQCTWRSNQSEWPGAGREEEDGRGGLGPTPLGGGDLLRLLTPSCAALLRYCCNVLPDQDDFIAEKREDTTGETFSPDKS